MASGIYQIRNTTNGRLYIGSAVNLKARWRCHRGNLARGTHHSWKLQRDYAVFGLDTFEFTVLEECGIPELLTREQYYLDSLSPSATGYNILSVAGSPLGTKQSRATIEKKRATRAGYVPSDETRKRIGDGNRGKVRTDEFKEHQSVIHKGKPLTEEHKKNVSKSKLGVKRGPMSSEQKGKIRESLLGRKRGPMGSERREKIRAAQTPECIARRVATRKANLEAAKVCSGQGSPGLPGNTQQV